MTGAIDALVAQALATGRLAGLPDRHLIDGRFVASASGKRMPTIDPGTGAAFAEFAAGDAADVDAAVQSARHAFDATWRRTAPRSAARSSRVPRR